MRRLKLFRLAILLTAVALISAPFLHAEEKGDKGGPSTYDMLKLFGDVFDRVRQDYVEPVKEKDLIEAAINGMLSSLDPHSSYMNEKQFGEMQVQTKGEFGGLGIEVTMDNGLVKVVSPIDDTPAFKAGIKAGDYITYIDDQPVLGMSLSDAVDKMRGAVGTKVKLSIMREDTAAPIDITIARDVIHIKSVRGHTIGNVMYVRVSSFTEVTTDVMRSEIAHQKKEIGDGKARGLVLDLRNNPGGLLDQAVSVSDAFLTHGEIVSTRERDPNNTKRFNAHAGDEVIPESMPMVVLINNGSASASEIVSGALQDHKRAVVLGTQSFGKGSVQTVIPLPGHGAIRLTTARYYTPSGRSIQAKGITPDIIVQPAKIELIKSEKSLREADLRHRLKNLQDEKNKKDKSQDKSQEKSDAKPVPDAKDQKDGKDKDSKDKDEKAKTGIEPELDTDQDFQLQRAVDLLQGLSLYKTQE